MPKRRGTNSEELHGLRSMSDEELIEYRIDCIQEKDALLIEDVESSLVLPFLVFTDTGRKQTGERTVISNLLNFYENGKTMHPTFPRVMKQMFVVDVLVKHKYIHVLIEVHEHGIVTYSNGRDISNLLYESHREDLPLIALLSGKIRRNHELPTSCTTIKSNFCFCSTRCHQPHTANKFSGSWTQCADCDLWCHSECIGNLASCPQCS